MSYQQQMQAPRPPMSPKPPMSRAKKIAIGAAVVVCAPVVLAGMVQGAEQAAHPAAAPATTAAAAPATTLAASSKPSHAPKVSATDPAIIDAAFVGLVESDDHALQQYPASELIDSGRQICSDVRGGMAVSDEASVLTTQYDAQGAGVLLGVAPGAYCKDLESSIEQQVQALH